MMMRFLFRIGLPLALISAGTASAPAQRQAPAAARSVPLWTATVVNRYPHDPSAFTQGLLWHDGYLYEGTGQIGRSQVRRVSLADGKVRAAQAFPPGLFGEGLARWGRTLISVTWHNRKGFRWDLGTLRQTGQFTYAGEGWGLTADKTNLILSDGSPVLRFMDPISFAERRQVTVTANGRRLAKLNELEYVRGEVFANIWETGFIARIDPASGQVTGLIDLRPLVAEVGLRDNSAVLNGIAYDARRDRLFVTGKYWPTLFEIRLTAPKG